MKYINLLIFAIIGNIQQILSFENIISLYNSNDKITVLTSQNFSSTVYQSKTAWLIEFYVSWCGHCQTYANIYRELAIDTWTWKTIVRIGAINCVSGENKAICLQHNIHRYPTLRLIPPETVSVNTSKVIILPATDAINVKKELIKELDNLHKKYKLWPYLTPVNRITLEELYTHIPSTTKLLLVIVEKREDITGQQIMLDFSKYHEQLSIFRTTTDGRLWYKFHINRTDVPALFLILRNRTAQRISIKQNINNETNKRYLFIHAIQSYINKTKSIDNFNHHNFEEIIFEKNKLKNIKLIENKTLTDKYTIHRKINMIDLELALSYMFQEEIPQIKEIHGEIYNTLVQWLTILTKYFPGRGPVMGYLKHLLLKVNEQSNGFSGNTFRNMIDMKTANAYIPNHHEQYQHCAGSTSKYRGYPCALWLLFHTLTVSQYHQESQQINIMNVLLPIKNYIKYFFSCRQCSDHFMNETMNINQLNSKNNREGIIYLWMIHNNVNKRLRGDITEDPKHPKVQFPSIYICATCHLNNHEYDLSNTIDFIIQYYSKENIETSLIFKKSHFTVDLLSKQEYSISQVEFNNRIIIEQFGIIQLLQRIIQRYTLYIFIAFIIIIILLRRRYCKAKKTRYTL